MLLSAQFVFSISSSLFVSSVIIAGTRKTDSVYTYTYELPLRGHRFPYVYSLGASRAPRCTSAVQILS